MQSPDPKDPEMIARMAADRELQQQAAATFLGSVHYRYSYNFKWLGRPIIQYPQDMIAAQEVIWEVKPDLIVETGIAQLFRAQHVVNGIRPPGRARGGTQCRQQNGGKNSTHERTHQRFVTWAETNRPRALAFSPSKFTCQPMSLSTKGGFWFVRLTTLSDQRVPLSQGGAPELFGTS